MPTRTNRPDRVKARRDGAAERATARAARPHSEQLALIATRPGNSTKETARLHRLAMNEEVVEKPKVEKPKNTRKGGAKVNRSKPRRNVTGEKA
jgi:hypothetical protein